MDNLLKRNSSELRGLAGNANDIVLNAADILQDAFKAGALLRLGYTIRNGIDSQLRIAASVGSIATLRHLGPGIKNLINNTIPVPARLVDTYRAVDSGRNIKQVQQDSVKVINELKELRSKIGSTEAILTVPLFALLMTKVPHAVPNALNKPLIPLPVGCVNVSAN